MEKTIALQGKKRLSSALETDVSRRVYESIKAARPISSPDRFSSFLDRDNEDIEKSLFGVEAVDCLSVTKENRAAIPVGSPFLMMAEPINRILRRFKGIYSMR